MKKIIGGNIIFANIVRFVFDTSGLQALKIGISSQYYSADFGGNNMKAFGSLPDGYREICSVDLKKDKKAAVCVNLLAIAIAVILVLPMNAVVPFYRSLVSQTDIKDIFIKYVVLLVLMVLYIILHELVHGVAMRICGTKKVKYGFNGMYAFAGSDDYYDKTAYIFIALAPIVLWGVVLAVVNILVPAEWFWIIYIIQVLNLSGAAGDLYVSVKFSRLPRDILVQDYGIGMIVYSGSNAGGTAR